MDENAQDLDFASGNPLVLPDLIDGFGLPRQLVVASAKDQSIYLAERSNMGKYSPDNNNTLYQYLPGALPGGTWSMPAFFNNTLFYCPVGSPLLAFPFQNAHLSSNTSQSPSAFGYPGATPSVSANGTNDGIVWAIENVPIFSDPESHTTAVIHAYAATNLANELYNSSLLPERDDIGIGNKFTSPTIASARVYVPAATGVGVFGLLDQSALTPLQQWRNSYFGNPSDVGAGANSASPAGDGVANLVKYALGLDPFVVVTNTLIIPGVLNDAGQSYFTLAVNRTTNRLDVIYRAEVSNDLITWNSGPAYTTTVTATDSQLGPHLDSDIDFFGITDQRRPLVFPPDGCGGC